MFEGDGAIFTLTHPADNGLIQRSHLIEDDEERSEARGDELDADAEGDDELVRGDGEEEVPNVGGLQEQEEIEYPDVRKSYARIDKKAIMICSSSTDFNTYFIF